MADDELLVSGKRFSVRRRLLDTKSGGKEARDYITHPGSVVILPLLDDGRVVLIRNTRFVLGRALWELPAGTREPNEPPAQCAARELEEETGYRASTLTPLVDFYPAPGLSDERMFAFVATGLVQTAQKLDEVEQIEVHPTSVAELQRMIRAREIEDAKTLVAVLLWSTRAGC